MDNVHATAQAVWDIRRLLSWIRAQQPESPIGMNSISLGGYVTSLVASLEDGLMCAILGVPVADLIELLGRHAGLSPDDPRRHTVTLAEPIGRMVSPLSLESARADVAAASSTPGSLTGSSTRASRSSACGSTGADPRSSGTTAATPDSSSRTRAALRR